ncbi:MAG: acyl carrier protein [Alphaproteobacteria bacterium]|nr:acyl carrier protein [Alphaproteobacteria bacterium]
METVRQQLNQIIAKQFQVDPETITDTTSIDEDLRATSLDHVEVVMAVEDGFGITIFDDEASELRTVSDVLACVTAHLGRHSPGLPPLPASVDTVS